MGSCVTNLSRLHEHAPPMVAALLQDVDWTLFTANFLIPILISIGLHVRSGIVLERRIQEARAAIIARAAIAPSTCKAHERLSTLSNLTEEIRPLLKHAHASLQMVIAEIAHSPAVQENLTPAALRAKAVLEDIHHALSNAGVDTLKRYKPRMPD